MRRIYSLIKPIKYDSEPLDAYKGLLCSLLEKETKLPKRKPYVGNEIATIVAVLAAHCVLTKVGTLRLTDVAVALTPKGITESEAEFFKDKLDLRKRVKAFQSYFTLQVITVPTKPASASEAIPIVDENADLKLRSVCNIVDNYELLFARPSKPLIIIGAGRLLVSSFVPEVVQRYREKCPVDDFDIMIESGLPQQLRSEESKRRYDIIVTSFEDGEENKREIHDTHLPMHLLFDRRAKVPQHSSDILTESEIASLLNKRMVVVPDPIRSPNLSFATKYIPDSSRYVTTEVWSEAMGITLSGGDACCAAYPQIFTDEERSLFRSIELPEEIATMLRLGALRPGESKHNRSKDHVRIADGIWGEFGVTISELSALETPDMPKAMSHAAHLTEYKGEKKWLHGTLKDLVVTPGGYFRGTHIFSTPTKENRECHFEFYGRLTADVDRKIKNLTWSGMQENVLQRRSADMHASETYSVAITATSDALDSFAAGMWCGRATWTEEKRPHFGHFVLYSGAEKNDEQITRSLDEYYDSNRKYKLGIDGPGT